MKTLTFMKTTKEPKADTKAQIAAVNDPKSAKNAAFFAKGTPVPKIPAGLLATRRPEGTIVSKTPVAAPKNLTSGAMAGLLGYPETKARAIRSGAPVVVQGRTSKGAVAHESLASPAGIPAAVAAARAAVPKGKVVITTPLAVLARRKAKR